MTTGYSPSFTGVATNNCFGGDGEAREDGVVLQQRDDESKVKRSVLYLPFSKAFLDEEEDIFFCFFVKFSLFYFFFFCGFMRMR